MVHLQPASQEEERVNRAWTIGVLLCVLVVSCVLSFVARGLLQMRAHGLSHAATTASQARPEPSVGYIKQQTFRQRASGQDLKASQRKALQHFAWVDRERGIVSIPIDVAIDLELAEQTR
jgi:hypothetical protein